MRLALTLPRYWPEVHRGTERVVHDLALQMAERGHDVSIITSHLAPTSESDEEGVRVIRVRRPPYFSPMRWYEDHLESAPGVAWHAARGNYDLVNAFVPAYAWAAVKARRFGGPPVVFSFHGIPIRPYLVGVRYRMDMLATTVEGVAATTVLSEAAAAYFRRYLLTDPDVVPAGYFPADFELDVEGEPGETLVCAASLDDPRKRGPLLLRAFERLREKRKEARLVVLVRATGAPALAPELRLPEGVIWREVGSTADVAAAYARASASVLAAVDEAQGLVVIESLASGTPVVAARSGALPAIVDSDEVGRLFRPDDEDDLVRAMDEALDLAGSPGTAAACRKSAAPYRWDRLIGLCEDVYERAIVKGGDR